MNAKQKIHQAKLSQWAVRFQEQAFSGLTVKAWCAENNVTIHTYNYWSCFSRRFQSTWKIITSNLSITFFHGYLWYKKNVQAGITNLNFSMNIKTL